MQRRYLSEEEQRRLLNAAKSLSDPLARRDYHWMAALIATGMRITEFSRLTVSQVHTALSTGWLVSRKHDCKGGRANEYCVAGELEQHLRALVRLSDEQAREQALSIPENGQPLVWGRDIAGRAGALSVRSYENRLKEWATAAGLDPRISPHWLRHTRAMNIVRRSRASNPLRVAQIALGHRSLSSTGVYLRMSREEFEREIQAVDRVRVPRHVARRMAERQEARA